MEFTIATLEDNHGATSPSSTEIANFISTMSKEQLMDTFNKLPDYQKNAICPCRLSDKSTIFDKPETKIAISGVAGAGVGYAVYGVGGALIGGLLSGGIAYYLTSKQ